MGKEIMAKRNLQNVFFDKLSFYLIASGIFGLVTLTPRTFSPGAISEFWQNTDKAVEIDLLRLKTCQISLKSCFQIFINLIKELDVDLLRYNDHDD